MKKLLIALSCGVLGASGLETAEAQTGDAYRLFANSLRVDRASHWQNWELQNDRVSALKVPIAESGMFEINTSGIKPVFFRRKINVATDAEDFTYLDLVRQAGAEVQGGAFALSNQEAASFLIDDDLSTYWEPDTPSSYTARLRDPGDFSLDNLRQWEVEVDLGRASWVDSVTVIFPAGQVGDEFLGDPVKAFILFLSMGERFPFPLGTNLDFTPVGQVATGLDGGEDDPRATVSNVKPVPGNERYLQVTFRPDPLDQADFDLDGRPDIEGSMVQYVRLTITDSDFWRDEFLGEGEIGLERYNALPAERRGALVYQRATQGGF